MNIEQPKKTMLDQLSILYYSKWLFAVPLALGALIGLAVSYAVPEYYRSTTLILVEDQQVPEEYVPSADSTPFGQRLNTITQQMLSRTKLQQIIREFDLYDNEKPGLLARTVARLKGLTEEPPPREAVIERMRGDIEFKVAPEVAPGSRRNNSADNAFTITYTGSDPEMTMQITNTIASLFIEENLKVREKFAEGTTEFLTHELERSKGELEGQERLLKNFKETNMGSLPEQLDANLRTLDRLQMELQSVTASVKNNEDRRLFLDEQLKHGADAPSGAVSELDRLRGELAVMQSMYKDTYPDVIILKRRVKELEEQSKRELRKEDGHRGATSAELAAVMSQIGTLKGRESQLRKQIEDYERRVESTPTSEQKQSDLQRDYKISLQNYQALLEKKMSAKLAEEMEKRQKGVRFRVIDPANVPDSPAGPNKLMITGFGILGGGALGVGLVALFEIINPAFRKPEDFEGVLPYPVLATIPVFQIKAKVQEKTAALKLVKGRK